MDQGLDILLDLDGMIFPREDGHWIRITAARITPTKHTPHGISYSLTLHDRANNRIIGFDNAHGIKSKRKGHAGRKVTWDHRHHLETVEPYNFTGGNQLIDDFWAAVYDYLGEPWERQ